MNKELSNPQVGASTPQVAAVAPPATLPKGLDWNPIRLQKTPHVQLVITSTTGEVLGTFSFGEDEYLANWLRRADQMDEPRRADRTDDKEKPVNRSNEALLVLGQDMFVVRREYAMALRVLAYPIRSDHEIMELAKLMPATANYTFIVAY